MAMAGRIIRRHVVPSAASCQIRMRRRWMVERSCPKPLARINTVMRRPLAFFLAAIVSLHAASPSATLPAGRVKSLKITVLSTMLADRQELGEWGFAALVEADGHRIL